MSLHLYYFHDPMCSWCWGYQPVWNQLQTELDNKVNVIYVLGGLAKDCDEPMPLELQQTIQRYWHKIHDLLGTEFNHDFWEKNTPRRSTYLACRAVIAAKNQGLEKEMINAIQQGYYLRALNPSDQNVLLQLANEIKVKKDQDYFNIEQFQRDLTAEKTNLELRSQIGSYHQLSKRGFPSLTLKVNEKYYPVKHDYQCHKATLQLIQKITDECCV